MDLRNILKGDAEDIHKTESYSQRWSENESTTCTCQAGREPWRGARRQELLQAVWVFQRRGIRKSHLPSVSPRTLQEGLLQEGLLELVINCFLLKGVVNSHLPSNFDRISWEWRAKGFYNLKFALLQRGHEKMFFSPSVEMPRIHLQRTLHGMPEAGGSQSPGGGAERA